MIWAILALVGVPLWLCALGISVLVFRTRALKGRPGNMAVRVRRPGRSRWTRANAIWVSDVFVWRASPAAWAEDVRQVNAVSTRAATPDEHAKLRRLGDEIAVVTLTYADGATLDVAASPDAGTLILGPFAGRTAPPEAATSAV
jgi:hypothetical protein